MPAGRGGQSAGAALFIHDLGLPDAVQTRLRALVEQHDQIFRSIIDEGIRSGELRVADPAVAPLLMHGAINVVPSWYKESRRMSPERLADEVTGTLLQLFGGGPA